MLKESEIKQFIDDDKASEKKRLARLGQRYYEAEHDILNYRLFYYDADGDLVEDTTRSNIKIAHPFFTELVDQLSAYILSFDENPIRACNNADGLQSYLDEYFDDEFWSEIDDLLTGANAKGFEYLYGFKDENDRLHFECADSLGVIEVREKDSDDKCSYFIYWYIDRIDKGKKVVKRIQVWSNKEIYYYVQINDGEIKLDDTVEFNPRPHVIYNDSTGVQYGESLGFIPFWRLDNTRKQFSGLKPIKKLIDDYDLHSCSLSNNLVDFDHPIYAVTGYDGTDLSELMSNLKTKKTIGMDNDGNLDIKTIDIPYQARKEKLEIDEKNIYRFGMGLNTAGLKDTNATTNIAIKTAYILLDLKANKLTSRLKKMLKQVVKVVLDEINITNGKDFKISDVMFDFKMSIPVNETENIGNEKLKAETQQILINNIMNAANVIGDDETLKALCEILEIDYDKLKDKLPNPNDANDSLQDALTTFESGGENANDDE